jgi:hypothetical protein
MNAVNSSKNVIKPTSMLACVIKTMLKEFLLAVLVIVLQLVVLWIDSYTGAVVTGEVPAIVIHNVGMILVGFFLAFLVIRK